MDLDLEAPGMHFKLLDDEQRDGIKAGFVELMTEFLAYGMPPAAEVRNISSSTLIFP